MKKEKGAPFQAAKTRAFRAGGYSVLAGAIVIAIAVAVNIFMDLLPSKYTQLDNSAGKLFTLSQQSELLAAGLEEEVEIYWIVQSGQEDELLGTLLDRYQGMSDKISVIKKDPDLYPGFASQYSSGTVYNNSLVVQSGERYRYVDYSGIYEYDYSSYSSSGYELSFRGESAVTSAIDYVTKSDIPKIYVLSGHGEASLSTTYESAVEEQNFELEELELLSAGAVPEDADALLIYSPQSDISAQDGEMLRAYLQKGGKLILITDPPEAEPLSELEALMAEYGVEAVPGIVIEADEDNYAWGTPYYLLPELGEHSITSPLSEEGYRVLLPVAQGLQISEELPEGVSVTELLSSSSSAYSKAAGYSLTSYDREEGDTDGPFTLATAVTAQNEDGSQASILWVSSAALLDDSSNSQSSGGNQSFFLNGISWMCGQEDSISIRAVSLGNEYLTISSRTLSRLSLLFVGLVPLAVLGTGIVIHIRRKRQ